MAIIQVNHQTLRATAQAIDEYCDVQDREMKKADADVKQMLQTDWIGPDAMEFGKKWDEVGAQDSVSMTFRNSLKSYSRALKASANAYQDAQEAAYNLAALLPK